MGQSGEPHGFGLALAEHAAGDAGCEVAHPSHMTCGSEGFEVDEVGKGCRHIGESLRRQKPLRREGLQCQHRLPDAILFESLPEGLVPREGEERLNEQRVKRLAASCLHDAEGSRAAAGGIGGFEEAGHSDDTRGDGNRAPRARLGPLPSHCSNTDQRVLDFVGHPEPLSKAARNLGSILQPFTCECLFPCTEKSSMCLARMGAGAPTAMYCWSQPRTSSGLRASREK